LLIIDTTFLVLLDIVAGLSFLMSAKLPERGEMSAVYSSFRDVSGLLSPGAARLVLLMAPLSGVFSIAVIGCSPPR